MSGKTIKAGLDEIEQKVMKNAEHKIKNKKGRAFAPLLHFAFCV